MTSIAFFKQFFYCWLIIDFDDLLRSSLLHYIVLRGYIPGKFSSCLHYFRCFDLFSSIKLTGDFCKLDFIKDFGHKTPLLYSFFDELTKFGPIFHFLHTYKMQQQNLFALFHMDIKTFRNQFIKV